MNATRRASPEPVGHGDTDSFLKNSDSVITDDDSQSKFDGDYLLIRDDLDYAIVNKVDHLYVNYNSCYWSSS